MMSKRKPYPILNHIRFHFQDGKSRCCMISMISNLNLQRSSFSEQLKIIRLHSQSILEALSRLQEIFSLLVDGATCMPTE